MAKKTIDFHGARLYPLVRIADQFISAYERKHSQALLRNGLWAELAPAEFMRVTSQEFSANYNIDTRFAQS